MAPRKPKAIGTDAEVKALAVLTAAGIEAHRKELLGVHDQGDIHSRGHVWQVKGGDAARFASDAQITRWLHETREQARRRQQADRLHRLYVPVLVLARWRQPTERWWVVLGMDSLEVRYYLGQFATVVASADLQVPADAVTEGATP